MKTVFITGASGAIGTALSIAFAKEGYALALHYHKNDEKLKKLAQIISENYSVPVLTLYADISKSDDVKKAVSAASDTFGKIDVLVNNAGVAQQKLFTDITDDDWEEMMSVDLDGVFYSSREVLKEMLKVHSGVIINISSMWGQVGASCEVHYSTAKAGVIGMTKALAKEVAPSNIRVNCIAPGVVMSDMLKDFSEDDLKALADETPLGKLGTPKQIADCAVFLASQRAEFITGQVIGVNGGFVI